MLILITSSTILNNCDRKHDPAPIKHESESKVIMPEPESTLGVYDSSFDKAQWTAMKNTDGRKVLKHKIVADCYVGYNTEPLGYEEPEFHEFSISKKVKMFQGKSYDVFTVREKDRIWCVTYSKQHTNNASDLSVYNKFSTGKCSKEAEMIINSYEKSMQQAQ